MCRARSLLALVCLTASAQQIVTIHVDGTAAGPPLQPVWNFFGYDEPNNTYTPNGVKLLSELGRLSETPARIRTHHLLTTGTGEGALKWGSTNAYTEDASVNAIYDWTIVDRIFDTYRSTGTKPFVEIGFMPKALSTHPEPYQPDWKSPADFKNYYLGWSYPPVNYEKWGDLVYNLVRHTVTKYGETEVKNWYWEVWNEPDISYWHGTPEEYDKLYDFTAAAVKRALPAARVGGPASTSPRNPKAAAFLRQFLQHCSAGTNYATNATGAPLDFITFHANGQPQFVDGHVRMGLAQQMQDVAVGLDLVESFPQYRRLGVILTESDPEGCAACSAAQVPANAYRNGALYPAYTAVSIKTIAALAARHQANLEGVLTWAFEFEDQPYFAGLRDLATNGIDKPVLNFFRMAGLMRGTLLNSVSDGAVSVDDILTKGVREHPDIDALAARTTNEISVMLWNYQDEDLSAPEARVRLIVSGIPAGVKRVLIERYLVDAQHSNSYAAWQRLGSPPHPSGEQYKALEKSGELEMADSPRSVDIRSGSAEITLPLRFPAVSLVKLSW